MTNSVGHESPIPIWWLPFYSLKMAKIVPANSSNMYIYSKSFLKSFKIDKENINANIQFIKLLLLGHGTKPKRICWRGPPQKVLSIQLFLFLWPLLATTKNSELACIIHWQVWLQSFSVMISFWVGKWNMTVCIGDDDSHSSSSAAT